MSSPAPISHPNPWTTAPKHSDLVSIGTHSLEFIVSGPPRIPNSNNPNHQLDPLIIIFTGAGDNTISWQPVLRLLYPPSNPDHKPLASGPQFRTLLYSRSGLGLSTRNPNPNGTLASTAALELTTALSATSLLHAPLILLAHSYGAIVAREFLHLHPSLVAGLVLIEPASERQHHFYRIPDPDFNALLGGLSYGRVIKLREEGKLSVEEYRERARQMYGSAVTAGEEGEGLKDVCETLGRKGQIEGRVLGERRPVSVVRVEDPARDWRRVYEAGVEAGNGSEEERERFRDLLGRVGGIEKGLKEEMLGLSGNGRMRVVGGCGHNVHIVRPDVVVEEVLWAVEEVRKLGGVWGEKKSVEGVREMGGKASL